MAMQGPEQKIDAPSGAPIPPPPPGSGASIPPPPPNNMANGIKKGDAPAPVVLDAKTVAEIEAIKVEVTRLQDLINKGDVNAKKELLALRKKFSDELGAARKKHVDPIENLIRAKDAELKQSIVEVKRVLDADSAQRQQLLEMKSALEKQAKDFEGHPRFATAIADVLKETVERLAQHELRMKQQADAATVKQAQLEKEIAEQKGLLPEAKKLLVPLIAKRDAVPDLKVKAEEGAKVVKNPFDITILESLGFLDGIFLDNLRKFITLEGTEEEMTKMEVITKYAGLTKLMGKEGPIANPDFNEQTILGIACGYITRPVDKPFCLNQNLPLKGAIVEPALEGLLKELLEHVYKKDKSLAAGAHIPLVAKEGAAGPAGFDAIKGSLQQLVAKGNAAVGAAPGMAPGNGGGAPAPAIAGFGALKKGDSKGKEPTAKDQPAMPANPALNGKDWKAIDKHRAKLEEEHKKANKEFVNPLARGGDKEKMGPDISTPNLKGFDHLIRDLDVQKLALRVKTLTEELAAERAKPRGTGIQETPVTILQNEGIKGLQHAYDFYKSTNAGKVPTPQQMNTWGQCAGFIGRDMTTYRGQFKTLKK